MVTFAASDGIDYPLERKQDWSRQWMEIGIKIKDFFVCYEWIGNNQGELGIRKAPLTIINSENMKLIKTSNNEDNPAQGGLSVADGCRCLTKELDMIAC